VQQSTTSTSDQIRRRIDRGEAADKVDFPDPAAAPLGTDAEAGGAPPSRAERAMASHAENRADAPEETREARRTYPPYTMVGFFVLLALCALAIAVYAAR